MSEETHMYDRLTKPRPWPKPAPFAPLGVQPFADHEPKPPRPFDEQGVKDRILDAVRADDEAGVIAKYLAAERDECEHIALFTLRDSLTEEWTPETPARVETARLILRYLLDSRTNG